MVNVLTWIALMNCMGNNNSYFVSTNTTIKTLNIGTPRPATVVVLNIKQFNFTMK